MEKHNKWSISILGSGNVGRRLGTYFSSFRDISVSFYDINEDVIKELKSLGFDSTLDLEYALGNSNISFVAVPTPLGKNNLYDTSYLEDLSKNIGNCLKNIPNYHIFVIKSTVIPGTIEDIIIPTIEKYSGKTEVRDFGVIYNPEFLTVISNTWTSDKNFCINPNSEGRIVLGEGKNKNAGDIIEEFYKELDPEIPVLRTDYKTAEMTKLVANVRLALVISFSNLIFLASRELKYECIDIDADFIINSISRDSRIGKYGSIFKKAYGGPCFLKDTVALNTYLKNKTGNFPRLILDLISINDEMKEKYGIRE